MGKHEAQGEKKMTSLFRPHDNSGKVSSSRCYSTFVDSPLGLDSIQSSSAFYICQLKKKKEKKSLAGGKCSKRPTGRHLRKRATSLNGLYRRGGKQTINSRSLLFSH